MRKAIVVTALVCLFALPAPAGAHDSHGGFAHDSHGGFAPAPDSKGLGTLGVATTDSLTVALNHDSHGGLTVAVADSGVSNVGLSPTLQNWLFILMQFGLVSPLAIW